MRSKVDKNVIDIVKQKRLEKDLSQADLAYELGINASFIGRAESSKYDNKYNVQHINQLAKILECSPQDFLPKKPL